jgi:hypothetical protein
MNNDNFYLIWNMVFGSNSSSRSNGEDPMHLLTINGNYPRGCSIFIKMLQQVAT